MVHRGASLLSNMSPASQGHLEVERYIGSCLISSGCCKQEQHTQQQQQQQHRVKPQSQFWAGGAPLMQQQQQQQNNRVPLSRLAVHTQGAPLILSSQRGYRAPKQAPPLFNNISRPPPSQPLLQQQQQQQQRINNNNNKLNVMEAKKPLAKPTEVAASSGNVASIDSLSIASDESSGSNNSENSLPRIIKPRKRRKKDRKPPLVQQQQQIVTAKDNKAVEESLIVQQQQQPVLVTTTTQQQQQQQQQTVEQQPRLRSYSYDTSNNPRYNDNYYRRGAGINNRPQQQQQQQQQSVKTQEVVDTRQQQQRFDHPRHVQVKVLDDNRNVILQPVPLCQKANNYLRQQQQQPTNNRFFNGELDVNDECSAGLCQCRYCDPATLIWDVADQASFPTQYLAQAPMVDHHRGHHHHHHHRYAQVPVFLTARPIICTQEHANSAALEFYDNPCGGLRLRQAASAAERVDGQSALLRRSWSDPTSYFNDEIVSAPSRDVGVIGDRGGSQDASTRSRNPWRGDALSCGSSSPIDQPASPTNSSDSGLDGNAPQALQVSTEIVTSPNGHRDLEIKFYSSSPTLQSHYSSGNGGSVGAVNAEVGKSAFAFPDDDSEEFSDIWSYHESKLQQDFRTLLQAGED